jgi:hypothetical protein
MRFKMMATAAVLAGAALAMTGATSAAQADVQQAQSTASPDTITAWSKGHVNSTGYTNLFASPNGDASYGLLNPCTNFLYDAVINGRYRTDLGGYVSTAKAGPGWCGD